MYKIYIYMVMIVIGLILGGCLDSGSISNSQVSELKDNNSSVPFGISSQMEANTEDIPTELKELMKEKIQDPQVRAKLEEGINEKMNNHTAVDLPKEIDLAINRQVDEKNKFWGLDNNINDETAPHNYAKISPAFLDEEKKKQYDSLKFEHVRELRELLQKYEITGPFSFTRQLGTSSEMQTEILQSSYIVGSFVSGNFTGPTEVTYGIQVWTITDYVAPLLDILGTAYEGGFGSSFTIQAYNSNSNALLYQEFPIYAYTEGTSLCIIIDTLHSLYFEPPVWNFDITCIYE